MQEVGFCSVKILFRSPSMLTNFPSMTSESSQSQSFQAKAIHIHQTVAFFLPLNFLVATPLSETNPLPNSDTVTEKGSFFWNLLKHKKMLLFFTCSWQTVKVNSVSDLILTVNKVWFQYLYFFLQLTWLGAVKNI